MTKQTHIVDGVAYCGSLEVALPFIGMRDATLGACSVGNTPPGRITNMYVSSRYDLTDKRLTDVTKFENCFLAHRGDPPIPFPSANMFAVFLNWQPGQYVAMEFVAPADTGRTGIITHGETMPGPNLDASISTLPGDFESQGISWRCSDMGPGKIMLGWKQPSMIGGRAPLIPGQTYYLNVRLHDPNARAPYVTLQSNHN